MAINRINHYSIRTTDLKASEKFYTEVMGFTVGPRPPFDFPGLWLYKGDHADYDNAVVHITGTVDHIAFAATGLQQMLAHLKAGNVPHRERTVPSMGLHQIFLDDPSEVVIELNYPAAEPA